MNPRDRKPGPTVFETAAFGRSATPPGEAPGTRYQEISGSRRFLWLVPGAWGLEPDCYRLALSAPCPSAAWAAANRAMGTRGGLHDT